MYFNFQAAIAAIGAQTLFRVANQARPNGEYLLATLLPELPRPTYAVSAASMTIRSTMAGMVGMDSPFPPGGAVDVSKFMEQTAKFANDVPLSEAAIRELQQLWLALNLPNTPDSARLQAEMLNFYDKVVIQPHLDAMEFLRGQALSTGTLDWVFNGITLSVDYGVPSANKFTKRTLNDTWDGSASKFWTDWYLMLKKLNAQGGARAIIMHDDTLQAILSNSVNAVVATTQSAFGAIRTTTIRKLIVTGGQVTAVFTPDVRDQITIISYSAEGEALSAAGSGATVVTAFIPKGVMIGIANNTERQFVIGQGSTPNPDLDNAIGYTHLAPTVEGGGVPGRWGRLFTPEERPWMLRGQMVTNGLPVITNPNKIVIASSDLA